MRFSILSNSLVIKNFFAVLTVLGICLCFEPTLAQTVLYDAEKNDLKKKAYSLIEKGNALTDSGKITEALEVYTRASKLIPENPRPYYYIGFLKVNQGDFNEAELLFEKALSLWPDYPEANSALGAIFLSFGAYDKAYPLLNKALRLNPNLADATNNIGGYYMIYKHELDSAALYFKKTIDLDSLFTDAYINLGNIMLQQKNKNEALRLSKKAIHISPENANAHFLAGNIFFESGEYQKSVNHFNTALNLNPDLYEIHYNLGQAYLNLDNLEMAKSALKELQTHSVKLATLLEELINDYKK